ncbi:MAG: helix-turn-helix transcriptional regulator [Pseudomonadota bacterium]
MKKLIRRDAVLELCCISNSSLHRMINEGRFPAPVKVGKRSVAWVESEVKEWIERKINER